jgi:transitional endoplasmic reticulum ATPase
MCEILEPGEYFKVKKPGIDWEDIGGYGEVKERLEEMVSLPLKHPETFKEAGLAPRSGILMWGPPKSSMNTLAEAAAKSARASFISARAEEIMKRESEITHLYETASNLAPCVVFINEVDALAPRREAESTLIPPPKKLAPPSTTRLLFAEVDKVSGRKDIVTIGGTHRPDMLDPALLRNGRLDRKIFVPAPDYYDRLEILRMALNSTPIGGDVTPEKLAELTESYASSEILSLPRQATLLAIKEKGDKFERVGLKHFKQAMERVPPSLTQDLIRRYEEIYREECKHRYMY